MLNKKTLVGVFFCFLVFSLCPFMYGQANGSLSGTVADKTGSVIPNAKVTITAQATGVSRQSTTDGSGHYLVPLLQVADYTIEVEAQGFQTVEQKDIRLQVDEHREVNFTLNPASVSQQVEVNAGAEAVAVQTTNATLGQVITSQQVAELPLNGRDFVQLATLTPGTTQETNPGSFFNGGPSSEVSARGTYSLSVGGSRAQSTDWLLDGIDNNELTAGGIAILPSIDAIQEFKVLTYNYSAQYGTRAGPTVLVTTKSGTNQLHGSLFEFFRNTSLDARSYFAATKEQFNLNQFGGSLGGPIKKDKTFFFIDYQAKRQRHGIPFVGLVPTAAMRTGDYSQDAFGQPFNGQLSNPFDPQFASFKCDGSGNAIPANSDGTQTGGSPCNKIPANMIDPVGQSMMNLYPTPNANNPALGYNFTNVPVRKLNEGEFDVRLDHNISASDSLFARFSYDQAVSFVPGGSPGFAEANAFASTQNILNHGRNAAISETHIFSPNDINQITFGFNRIFNHISSFGDGSCESAKLGIQGADLNSRCAGAPPGLSQSTKDCMSCGMTSTEVGNYWALGDRGFAPFQGGTNVFDISDSFDMIRGKHDIRIGVGIRANQMNVETNAFQDGFLIDFDLTGDASADLLVGQMGGGIHDQTFNGATTGRRWKMFRPYIQDDWRVTNDLTLNLGLAWDFTTPITEAANRQANFDLSTGKLLVAGSIPISGCTICVSSDARVGVQLDKTALEPRIGIAWKPFGSQTTAVRAGYAIFHDSSWNQGAQGLWENPPYFAESDNFSGAGCPFGNATSPTPQNCGLEGLFLPIITSPPNPSSFPGTVQEQNLDFKLGMVQQFNLNVEHQLPGNVVLTAGYAGSRSTHILVDGLNLNITSPSACGVTAGYTLGCGYTPPVSPFGIISNNSDVGRAQYDSLQLKAETKSARHGLYALLGYTYARTYDSGFPDGVGTSPGATIWPLPGAQKADWALSQLNLNNQFTASVIYDLPFGKGKRFGGGWSSPVNTAFGGWEVNVIEKVTSGFPLFVVSANNSGSNFQWNGNSINRPNEISDPHKPGPVPTNSNIQCQYSLGQSIPNSNLLGVAPTKVGTVANWFNPCAFDSAPDGEIGTANRTPLSGPDFVNTDFSIIKHFPLPREGMRLDFRAEFFNLFNHAQFFLPGDSTGMQNLSSFTSFGVITQTVNNPRVMQFALKLLF
jgi:hypothetical protein